MIQAYSKREIRNTLYSLKKEWGCSVKYYHIVKNERDLKTGVANEEYQVLKIRRAVLLPSELLQVLLQGQKAPFRYGGEFNTKERFLIIDSKDLKIDSVEPTDYAVLGVEKYSLKRLEDFDFSTAYVFRINQIPPKEVE